MNHDQSRLYLVTDRKATGERDERLQAESLLRKVGEALEGGVRIVQYREKDKNWQSYQGVAQGVQVLCERYGSLFIVNDDVKLARDLNADGVHLGQDDMGCAEARSLLGDEKIIGISISSVEEAVAAEQAGANYISVGPIFTTRTKPDAGEPVGVYRIMDIKDAVRIPVIAIGGITESTLADVIAAGADYAAMVSGIFGQRDIRGAVERCQSIIEGSAPRSEFRLLRRPSAHSAAYAAATQLVGEAL